MGTIISLLIVVLIFGLVWWALTLVPLPPPMSMVVRVVFIVLMVLVLLGFLTGGISMPKLAVG